MTDFKEYILEQFVLDFCPFKSKYIKKYTSIEFNYKGQDYRMCKESSEPHKRMKYCLYKKISINESETNYEKIADYKSIDNLLDSKAIDDRSFVCVLFDEKNTKILRLD